ncbi:MAG: cytochrome c [Pseudobacteriovorax sp.]|nr:cytochrome c [Pseudobacteriovorax sp.]
MARPLSLTRSLLIQILPGLLIINCGSPVPTTPSYRQLETEASTTPSESKRDIRETNKDEDDNESIDGPNDEELIEEDVEDPAAIKAEMVAMGAMVYAERCAGCHGELAMSEKQGRTAAQIIDAAGVLFHNGVQWPNQDEALTLELALEVPQ